MKTLTQEIWLEVPQRRAIVSIHAEVERLVAESGVREGLALVNAMHIELHSPNHRKNRIPRSTRESAF